MFLPLKQSKRSSREQIAIQGVDNGILMLPGNKYRAIMEVQPVNFALRSEEEQEVVIDNFQSFLNALPCPVQILMRSRAVDMGQYLSQWQDRAAQEENPAYRKQIEGYTKFVEQIVADNSILTRKFYVVVTDTEGQKKGDKDIVMQRIQLNCDIIAKHLSKIGISSRLLDSLEVLDLFYSFYNPKRAKIQPITNIAQSILAESVS